MADGPHFYVYAITFDQDVFGIFATREEAGADLERQSASGGPAWDDCKVTRWRVDGHPELDETRQRVVEAAVAYCLGTNPDEHPLDEELRAAVRHLSDIPLE